MAGAHQLVRFLDLKGGVAERIGSGVSSRKEINPFGPQEGLTPAPIPIVRTGVREKVCHSSPPPPFSSLSLLSLLPHCGVFSLFTRGLLGPVPRPLSPLLLAAPAGHYDDEEEDHSSDAASNSQGQQEEVGEGGWKERR